MYYTLTPNPAIDLYVGLEELKPNHVNRTFEEDYQPNGKAINISIMLKRLGVANTALGFIAGFSGNFIKEELHKLDIDTDFAEVEGITRINIFANAEQEYKIVNKGPDIPGPSVEAMLAKLSGLPDESMLFVSGSLPGGVSEEFYVKIAEICKQKNIRLVLDISSLSLLDCLAYQPYLVKPNDDELAVFFDKDKSEMDEKMIIECSNRLLQKGARQVLVSRGELGAIYVSPDLIMKVTAPQGEVINTACSGDALLSMFVGKLEQGESFDSALRYASAAGSATAFSKGLCSLEDIKSLISETKIEIMKEEITNG